MIIPKQIQSISQKLEKVHESYNQLCNRKEILDSNYAVAKANIAKKYSSKKDDVKSDEENVLKYYRIAQDNSYNTLLIKGAIGRARTLCKFTK